MPYHLRTEPLPLPSRSFMDVHTYAQFCVKLQTGVADLQNTIQFSRYTTPSQVGKDALGLMSVYTRLVESNVGSCGLQVTYQIFYVNLTTRTRTCVTGEYPPSGHKVRQGTLCATGCNPAVHCVSHFCTSAVQKRTFCQLTQ